MLQRGDAFDGRSLPLAAWANPLLRWLHLITAEERARLLAWVTAGAPLA